MRQPHPNTHLVEAVIKALTSNEKIKATGRKVTVGLISRTFNADYPQAEIPSPRTIASIKKRIEEPEAPPSNLCKNCMGYGYLYEQTRRYFGDGTELTVPNRPHIEVTCQVCENSGIDPDWERPATKLFLKMGTTPKALDWETVKTYPGISEGVTITEQVQSESLEKTL